MSQFEPPPLLPHQLNGLSMLEEQRAREPDMPALGVAPPGAGKSRVMIELAVREVERGGRVILKVHRRMLLEQMHRVFEGLGIPYGTIASGYSTDAKQPIQIVSTQTLFARGVRTGKIDLPDATLMIDDEAHQQSGKMQTSLVYGSYTGNLIQEGYASRGCYCVGFTATPLMGRSIYQRLISFGEYSQLRRTERPMHQLVQVYSPDEIDTKGLRQDSDGEFSPGELTRRVEKIFGSVFDEWQRLNPMQLPAILYAPSVPSSRWFAHQFFARGVPVAHLDGEMALIPDNGKLIPVNADAEMRARILEMSRTGEIKCIMNRFVLREAIDMPWLYQGIFATVMGSLTTFLQSVGRLQRYWPEYQMKILQCHGGSYWRHGSPNDDRVWRLGMTNRDAARERLEKVINGEAYEGIRCPKCGCWRKSGPICANRECGNRHTVSVRAVRSVNGTLKLMEGRVFVKPTKSDRSQQLWTSQLFRSANKDQTVSSAVAQFLSTAQQEGVSVNYSLLNNAPPSSESPQYHMRVREVYPWTMRRRNRSSSTST